MWLFFDEITVYSIQRKWFNVVRCKMVLAATQEPALFPFRIPLKSDFISSFSFFLRFWMLLSEKMHIKCLHRRVARLFFSTVPLYSRRGPSFSSCFFLHSSIINVMGFHCYYAIVWLLICCCLNWWSSSRDDICVFVFFFSLFVPATECVSFQKETIQNSICLVN